VDCGCESAFDTGDKLWADQNSRAELHLDLLDSGLALAPAFHFEFDDRTAHYNSPRERCGLYSRLSRMKFLRLIHRTLAFNAHVLAFTGSM